MFPEREPNTIFNPTLFNKNKKVAQLSNSNTQNPENKENYTFAIVWFSTRQIMLLREYV